MRASGALALALVAGALQELALLVLAHLLAPLLDDAPHAPLLARCAPRRAPAARWIPPRPPGVNSRALRLDLAADGQAAAAQPAEPAVHEMIAAQEGEDRLATHAEALHLLQDRLVLRIDHQPAAQVADALGLEAEREMQPREVVIERGIEELRLRGGSAQLERAVEAALGEPETEPEIRAIARARRVEPMRRAEVVERGIDTLARELRLALGEVLLGGEGGVHRKV